jgi:hypothetical protein
MKLWFEEADGGQLGYFSIGIIDYVIYTQPDNLVVAGISQGWTFHFGTQKYLLF